MHPWIFPKKTHWGFEQGCVNLLNLANNAVKYPKGLKLSLRNFAFQTKLLITHHSFLGTDTGTWLFSKEQQDQASVHLFSQEATSTTAIWWQPGLGSPFLARLELSYGAVLGSKVRRQRADILILRLCFSSIAKTPPS